MFKVDFDEINFKSTLNALLERWKGSYLDSSSGEIVSLYRTLFEHLGKDRTRTNKEISDLKWELSRKRQSV